MSLLTDDDLRALVRAAIDRHFGGAQAVPASSGAATVASSSAPATVGAHPSHAQYMTIVNVGDRCVIEPGVDCNHCGYCRSHGH